MQTENLSRDRDHKKDPTGHDKVPNKNLGDKDVRGEEGRAKISYLFSYKWNLDFDIKAGTI